MRCACCETHLTVGYPARLHFAQGGALCHGDYGFPGVFMATDAQQFAATHQG
jgi:hypothetical protein